MARKKAARDTTGPGDRPLLILGMHRSGTSLAASLLADAGLDLGPNLLGVGIGNPRGHYEDLGFLGLHKRILVHNGLDEDGFSCPDRVPVPPKLAAEVADTVAVRRAAGRPWGWKDPRTTLLLDFYRRLLPQARFLCVFRRPWEVVDSLLRRGYSGDRVFEAAPVLAAKVYHLYNLRLLGLVDRFPDRCLVVEATQLAADPAEVIDRVGRLLDTRFDATRRVFDGELMHMDGSVDRAAIVAAACPEAMEVYLRLRRVAGSESSLPDLEGCMAPVVLGELAMREWVKYAGSSRAASAAASHGRELQAALGDAHVACTEAHVALEEAIEERKVLARHADEQRAELQVLRTHSDAQAADLRALQRHADVQAADLRQARGHADILAGELRSLRSHADTQAVDLLSIRGHADALAADLHSLRAHAEAQAADLHSLRAHAEAQAADLHSLRAHAAAQAAALHSRQALADTQAADLRTIRAVADAQAAGLQTLNEENEQHRQEVRRLRDEVADLRRQLEDSWSRRLARLIGGAPPTSRPPAAEVEATGLAIGPD